MRCLIPDTRHTCEVVHTSRNCDRGGCPLLGSSPTGRLLVEPGFVEAPAVEDAVDHHRDPVHPRVTAGAETIVVDDRPGGVLLQSAVDLPDQLLALLLVRLH